MAEVADFLQVFSDSFVEVQLSAMLIIIAIAKLIFGLAMVARDVREGGPSWPFHWNMLVGLWILTNSMTFWATFALVQYQVDMIYLVRSLQVSTIMTVWVGLRWARSDQDGNLK